MAGTYFPADAAFEAALARHERTEELAEEAEAAGFDDPHEYARALDEDAAEARADQARDEAWWD